MPPLSSPILRLPRELRDNIYRYAVLEPTGYIYNHESGRLRTAQNSVIDLSLSYTCNQIHLELQYMPLEVNHILFTPSPTLSITGRFNILQERYYDALTAMLSWMSEYVTSDQLDTLLTRYPCSDDIRKLKTLSDDQRVQQLKSRGIVGSSKKSMGSIRVLYDLLKLLSVHDSFHTLTAREYDAGLRNGEVPPYRSAYYETFREFGIEYDDKKHLPRYAPNSQKELLDRILEPWQIIDETELTHLEGLLPSTIYRDAESDSESGYGPEPGSDEDEPYTAPLGKSYHSATSCAVHFLRKLSVGTRKHIRHILIKEDHVCQSNPASHSHGLIPFCIENPKLHIDARMDIWGVLLWGNWIVGIQKIMSQVFLYQTAEYLREALLLPTMGMPIGQYTLEFYSRSSEMTQHLWDSIKRVAKIQEAAKELHRINPEKKKHLLLGQMVSDDFPTIIRRVMNDRTIVRFDACMGEPWDLDRVVLELENSPTNSDEWDKLIDLTQYEQQTGEFEALAREYTVSSD